MFDAYGSSLSLWFLAQLVVHVLLRRSLSALIWMVAFRITAQDASAFLLACSLLVATLFVGTCDALSWHFVFSLRWHRHLRHLLHPRSFPVEGRGQRKRTAGMGLSRTTPRMQRVEPSKSVAFSLRVHFLG